MLTTQGIGGDYAAPMTTFIGASDVSGDRWTSVHARCSTVKLPDTEGVTVSSL